MDKGALRRAQLVSPFGVGAMSVLVDGTSVITAGLDHWFEHRDKSLLAIEEYQEHDWRLESRLRVNEFRLPPDYRQKGQGDDKRNVRLTVPALRFPRWHFCIYCKRLERLTLTLKTAALCQDPQHDRQGKRPRMSQVPFVLICSAGHLDDFPFDKWVHKTDNASCNGVLRLKSVGGDGLEAQQIECSCGAKRSLAHITEGNSRMGEDSTYVTAYLNGDSRPYLCSGSSPWLAQEETTCGLPIRGALRSAGNVYFPKVESSIYIPWSEGAVSAELHELVRHPRVTAAMRLVHSFCGADITAERLRQHLLSGVPPELLKPFSDDDLLAGYRDLLGEQQKSVENNVDESDDVESLTGDAEWRFPEYELIRETPADAYLSATDPGLHGDLESCIDRVRSVDVLRETRVLRGFTRVYDAPLGLSAGKALLRREPEPPGSDWLPAYVVKGEGIYLELDHERLVEWEQREGVQARTQKIIDHYARSGRAERQLTPRLVLLHTLAHLLINELVFTCGYSSASLRERLYASTEPGSEMAGVLIYTAAGDSEGTMGGLVRMSRPENLRSVFVSAITGARWCSTDPVCMDAGEKGQGPDSCNLAACHGCALLPETSCEEFNRFLDRGLVIGTFDDPTLGYFSDFV